MADTLFIFFDQLEYTQESEIGESFDVSIYGDIIDADVGWALTSDGTSVQRHYHDTIEQAKKEVHPSELFHHKYWVTSDELMSNSVRLRTGEEVSVEDYDTVLISQVVFHTKYIRYLEEEYPELTIIGVQDESTYEIWSLSSRLQALHLESLRHMDGFVAEDPEYYRWVSGIVPDSIHLPLPLPRDHYEEIDMRSSKDKIILGCAPFNTDSSHFLSNIAVFQNLKDRGYDLKGEILAVREWQERYIEDIVNEVEGVEITNFIDEGYHQYLTQFKLALNLTPRSSAGRCVADYAGAKVPCIGSSHNDLQRRLFSETAVNHLDVGEATELAVKVLEHDDFQEKIIERSQEGLDSLKNHEEIEGELKSFIGDLSS